MTCDQVACWVPKPRWQSHDAALKGDEPCTCYRRLQADGESLAVEFGNGKGEWQHVTITAVSATEPGFKLQVDAADAASGFALASLELINTSFRRVRARTIQGARRAPEQNADAAGKGRSSGGGATGRKLTRSGARRNKDTATRAIASGAPLITEKPHHAGAAAQYALTGQPAGQPQACASADVGACGAGRKRARSGEGATTGIVHAEPQDGEQATCRRDHRLDPHERTHVSLSPGAVDVPADSARAGAAQSGATAYETNTGAAASPSRLQSKMEVTTEATPATQPTAPSDAHQAAAGLCVRHAGAQKARHAMCPYCNGAILTGSARSKACQLCSPARTAMQRAASHCGLQWNDRAAGASFALSGCSIECFRAGAHDQTKQLKDVRMRHIFGDHWQVPRVLFAPAAGDDAAQRRTATQKRLKARQGAASQHQSAGVSARGADSAHEADLKAGHAQADTQAQPRAGRRASHCEAAQQADEAAHAAAAIAEARVQSNGAAGVVGGMGVAVLGERAGVSATAAAGTSADACAVPGVPDFAGAAPAQDEGATPCAGDVCVDADAGGSGVAARAHDASSPAVHDTGAAAGAVAAGATIKIGADSDAGAAACNGVHCANEAGAPVDAAGVGGTSDTSAENRSGSERGACHNDRQDAQHAEKAGASAAAAASVGGIDTAAAAFDALFESPADHAAALAAAQARLPHFRPDGPPLGFVFDAAPVNADAAAVAAAAAIAHLRRVCAVPKASPGGGAAGIGAGAVCDEKDVSTGSERADTPTPTQAMILQCRSCQHEYAQRASKCNLGGQRCDVCSSAFRRIETQLRLNMRGLFTGRHQRSYDAAFDEAVAAKLMDEPDFFQSDMWADRSPGAAMKALEVLLSKPLVEFLESCPRKASVEVAVR